MPLREHAVQQTACDGNLAILASMLREHFTTVVLDEGHTIRFGFPSGDVALLTFRDDIANAMAKRLDNPKKGSPFQEIRSFMDEAFPSGSGARRSALREALRVMYVENERNAK